MRRARVLFVVAVTVVAAVAGACGTDSTRPAAVVNGVSITSDDVINELEAIGGNEEYVSAIEAGGTPVRGSTDGSFNSGFVSQVLARQIVFELIGQAVDERGIDVEAACEDAARRDLETQTGNGDPAAGAVVLDAFPAAYVDEVIGWNPRYLALSADLAEQDCVNEDAAEEYFAEHADEFERVCAAHILVDDQALASDLLAQLQAGADFATLAAENSTDGSAATGGDLGCASASDYVPAFADAVSNAEPGVVAGPVETEFGFHLILVDHFETPDLADVRDQVEQALGQAANQAFNEWFAETLAAAAVEVDTRYGEWDPATGAITPPASTTATTSSAP